MAKFSLELGLNVFLQLPWEKVLRTGSRSGRSLVYDWGRRSGTILLAKQWSVMFSGIRFIAGVTGRTTDARAPSKPDTARKYITIPGHLTECTAFTIYKANAATTSQLYRYCSYDRNTSPLPKNIKCSEPKYTARRCPASK